MKKIRLYLDFIPEHKASRGFTFELFKKLTEEGIPCELAVFGIGHFTRPQVRILQSPAELEQEEIIRFMNERIREHFIPDFDNEGLALEWNYAVLERRCSMFKEDTVIHVDICDIKGHYRQLVGDGLIVTNAGGVKYYHIPIFDTFMDDKYEPIFELIVPDEESEAQNDNISIDEVVSLLRIISERELDADKMVEHKVLREGHALEYVAY